jgi:hypothetical protein
MSFGSCHNCAGFATFQPEQSIGCAAGAAIKSLIARSSAGANRGQARRRNLRAWIARLHGTRPSTINLHEVSHRVDGNSYSGRPLIKDGIYPAAAVIVEVTNMVDSIKTDETPIPSDASQTGRPV